MADEMTTKDFADVILACAAKVFGPAESGSSALNLLEFPPVYDRCIDDSDTKAQSQLFDIINSSEWLNSKEAAAFMRIAVGTLRNWTSNGKIPPTVYRKTSSLRRRGGKIVFSKAALRELLLAQKLGEQNGN